ncbi:glucan 1,3 beta-glucosidase [Coprinopsis cinerea okayama7|uniref:glucan endo-1,3-beta-D-glucosidase n=1 Tax=Coprinopsis cinerea (strain Okayama-7 / 130 / ATCC MYA-4618 / FGSC 9003) TaxID=240176 RepID=A8NUR9_COPC7|nr:glucan 1,3 beta-glucosidase [Coprinopsis cinerea okayama7\|eukprot:XP_001836519.2 glucan 1,3 beta-glucosidase [Coprinopsis cinerea okayama7\
MASIARFTESPHDTLTDKEYKEYICPQSLVQHMEYVASIRAYSPSLRLANKDSFASADDIGLQERRANECLKGYIAQPYVESQSQVSLLCSRSRLPSATPFSSMDPGHHNPFADLDTPLPSSKRMMRNSNPALAVTKGLSEEGTVTSSTSEDFNQSIEERQKRTKKRRWLIAGIGFTLVGLIIGGIITGAILGRNRKATGGSGVATSKKNGGDVVKQSNPNDPSTFIKDPNLHQSFYGIAYTPADSQLPNCGNSLKDVITDIQLLSQLTKRIRLYGADCNQTALVLEAIRRTKVDMQVWLGNYPVATDNGDAYKRQRDIIKDAISTYGTDHIAGVTVGNEFMLNYVTAHGGASVDPNGPVANQGAEILIGNINDTRDMLNSMGLPKTLPVGTSDAGSYFNDRVLGVVDYGLANVHPWFANVSIDTSASWTEDFFQTVDVAQAQALPNRPKMYIAETGWPSKSSDAANESNGPSTASIVNLQKFLDTFVCQANANETPYFFFELFDEPWKDQQFGGVEGWWGLFNADRTLKAIKIPDCAAP